MFLVGISFFVPLLDARLHHGLKIQDLKSEMEKILKKDKVSFRNPFCETKVLLFYDTSKAMKPSSIEAKIPNPEPPITEYCTYEGNFKWTNGLLISNQDRMV